MEVRCKDILGRVTTPHTIVSPAKMLRLSGKEIIARETELTGLNQEWMALQGLVAQVRTRLNNLYINPLAFCYRTQNETVV